MSKTLSNIAYNKTFKQFGFILWENEPYEPHLPPSLKISGHGIWAKDKEIIVLDSQQAQKLLQYKERMEGLENPWLDASEKCLNYIGGLNESSTEDVAVVKSS